jgi:hybrid cluster-associated redox disulfide protein
MSMDVHPQLTVAEVLERWPATAAVFGRRCMACLGCAMAPFDTIGEAAAVYGIELNRFLAELRRVTHGEERGGR